MKTSFWKHGSKRNKKGNDPKFVIAVEEFMPAAYFDENAGEWIACLPNGCSMGSFETREEAVIESSQRLLHEGWTTDRALAERRSQKELELRLSGRLSFKKGKEQEFFACKKEIMEVA